MTDFEESFLRLKSYCEKEKFKGWDPYDGLNSILFRKSGLNRYRIARLIWIQLFKRSPLNLRTLALVPKGYNPQGLALFLSSYCKLYLKFRRAEDLEKVNFFSETLLNLRNTSYSGDCWGYNFDWQARAFYQPAHSPTVVATTFVVNALLEAYDITGNQRLMDSAISACNFVLKDLNRTYRENGNFAFSYSPLDNTQVYNASLLGTRLLSTVFKYNRDISLIEPARKSAAFCCEDQKADGSWSYGTKPYHQWIDSFHTGYNLECLMAFQTATGDLSFKNNIETGLNFYLTNFFSASGEPGYYSNEKYPIDINCPAQLVITLDKLGNLSQNKLLVENVIRWTIHNMQDKRGYFYYQLKPLFSSKTPYMRWSQSWIFYALTTLITCDEFRKKNS